MTTETTRTLLDEVGRRFMAWAQTDPKGPDFYAASKDLIFWACEQIRAASRASPDAALCTGCGKLPPHEGCEHICPACAPPTGSCDCPGCALVKREAGRASPEEGRGATGKPCACGQFVILPGVRMLNAGRHRSVLHTVEACRVQSDKLEGAAARILAVDELLGPPAPPPEDSGARLTDAEVQEVRVLTTDWNNALRRIVVDLCWRNAHPASTKEGGRHE